MIWSCRSRLEAWFAGATVSAALVLIVTMIGIMAAGPVLSAYQLLYLLEGIQAARCL